MHLDVCELRDFYYRTALGRVAQRAIRERLVQMNPPVSGHTVAGFGFAAPLLRPYLAMSRRVIALMPGPQGVMAWPPGAPNISVLSEEAGWPLSTGLVDRLVVLHGLEPSEQPDAVLAEAHRVLGPGGRAFFVVANRAGLWARRDVTPFGYGRPYSNAQLESELRQQGFSPERSATVLHAPPSAAPFWLRTARFWERLGHRLPWFSGGILIVEASKQVHAPTRGRLRAVVSRPLRALEGVRGPAVPDPAGMGAGARPVATPALFRPVPACPRATVGGCAGQSLPGPVAGLAERG